MVSPQLCLGIMFSGGKRHSRNIYAHTEAECEQLLAEIIAEEKAKIAAEKERLKQVG